MQEFKRCSRCGTVKPRVDFNRYNRRSGGLQAYCRECSALFSHMQYELRVGRSVPRKSRAVYVSARGAWLRSLKVGRPCSDCGRTFDPQVMQWDHLPGSVKIGDISAAFWGRPDEEVRREIAKCELVCTNCHTIRTFRRNGWDRPALGETEGVYVVTPRSIAA